MSHSFPLKNLPVPVQRLIRPMLLISLGLHGLLLLVPFSSGKNPILQKQEDTVKITQIPTGSNKPGDKSASKAPSKAGQSSRQATSSRARSVALPGSQGAETGQLGSVGEAGGTGTSGVGGQSGNQSNDPWADFPHYPGAKPGAGSCSGKQSCRQTPDGLDQVTAHFKEQLPAKKYTAPLITDEANRKIYQVTKAGKTLYLNLFTASGAVYVLAPTPLDNIGNVKQAVEVPAELYTALGQLNMVETRDTNFDESSYFYAKKSSVDKKGSVIPEQAQPGIDGSPQLVPNQTPPQVISNLRPKFESSGLKVSEVKPYGGGDVYKLQKGSAVGYLNLVPTKDRKGTNVIVWLRSPN